MFSTGAANGRPRFFFVQSMLASELNRASIFAPTPM